MSGVIGLGPLEENETTLGAMTSFQVSLSGIVAIGSLKKGFLAYSTTMNQMEWTYMKQDWLTHSAIARLSSTPIWVAGNG